VRSPPYADRAVSTVRGVRAPRGKRDANGNVAQQLDQRSARTACDEGTERGVVCDSDDLGAISWTR
jgi:hypothetical protein